VVNLGRHKKKEENRGIVIADGRITIPKKLREDMEIEDGTFFEAKRVDSDSIRIKFFKV